MKTMQQAVDEFLALKRIAVAGVSRTGESAGNPVYLKLRGAGYEVFATNPRAEEIEGDTCYPDLKSIPGGVEGVVAATHPKATLQVVQECSELGISYVWMHRSFGDGSVSQEAVNFCQENGIQVIPGGCPMMYCDPVDFGHKCIRWILGFSGGLPKEV